jgi:hypothetical protein
MLLSAERPNCGSLCLSMTRGRAAAPQWSGVSSPAGVGLEHVQTDNWFPRNLGEPCSLLGEFPAGDTGLTTPGLDGALVCRGANTRVQPRYRQAKETKCGGTAAGRHSVLIVPMKLANSTRLEPVEESEAPNHGTVFEKHGECIEIRKTCPRNRNG